jgi:hypothetical protein
MQRLRSQGMSSTQRQRSAYCKHLPSRLKTVNQTLNTPKEKDRHTAPTNPRSVVHDIPRRPQQHLRSSYLRH